MGVVVGPTNWSPNERFASWFLLRSLREDIKWMRSEDPKRFKSAIDKETTTVKEEFSKYVNSN